MKFLVVGAWQWSWYQKAFSEALSALGHDARGFGWAELFMEGLDVEQGARPKNLWTRLQQRIGRGPLIRHLNHQLVATAREFEPDIVFAYNATLILPSTLERMKRILPRTLLVQYSNDNPFSPHADWLLWRHLKRSVALYDVHFVYRHANLADFRQHGGRDVHLLRSYYIAETDFHVPTVEIDKWLTSDVLFAGHYEPDGRVDLLEAVAGMDVNFKLFGGTWNLAEPRLANDSRLRRFFPVTPLSRSDYRKAISGTKIALCFLSRLNGDTYTRRTFEIPAMRSFMLSEYTDDLASLFKEGHEAAYFRSREELLDKIRYYLKHEDERRAIARNGHQRLLRDGHDVVARARQVVATIAALRGDLREGSGT
jgi:spore maturation protein CgeB